MSKAGVTDPRACNQVEIEMRLGQLSTRAGSVSNGERAPADSGGTKGSGSQRGRRQVQNSDPLLKLPVFSPALIDEQMCTFHSGFKILGRCDAFFTVPVRLQNSDSNFCEMKNNFSDSKVHEIEVKRILSLREKGRALDSGEEASRSATSLNVDDLSDEAEGVISHTQRLQSSVASEGLVGEPNPQSGFVNGSAVTLGSTDFFGSDQLPQPPASWVRLIEEVSPPSEKGAPPIYKASAKDSTRFELQVSTTDGLRLEFSNGAVVSAGPRRPYDESSRDGVRLDLLARAKERRKAFRQFIEKKTPNDVQSSLQLSEDGVRDAVLGFDFPQPIHGRSFTTVPFLMVFNGYSVIRKAGVAQSNFRMPQWCGDARLSVAIERSTDDDGSPFTINTSELFIKDIELSFYDSFASEMPVGTPERDSLDERLARGISQVRFRKRCEYRLLDFAVGPFGAHRKYRSKLVNEWFGLTPRSDIGDASGVLTCTTGPKRSASLATDAVADTFLKLFVTDVISSQASLSRNNHSGSLAAVDIRATNDGFVMTRPENDDARMREVEVEVDTAAVVDAVMRREAVLADAVADLSQQQGLTADEVAARVRDLEDEAAYQVSELYNAIALRMLDALGSFARTP